MTELQKLSLAQLKDKQIVVLGLGLTGLSCLRYFQKHGIVCSVNDSRENVIDAESFTVEFPTIKCVQGKWDTDLIGSADLLVVSPGIDLANIEISAAIAEQCQVLGDVELYCQLSSTPILAVTGSNGKSTVVSLLAYLGNALGNKVQLGGNIGVPVLDQIDQHADLMVLELSSFQLETMKSMKAIAATVLNVSDDHLDRHQTFENYQAIKHKIYQQTNTVIYNRDDHTTIPTNVAGNSISFGSEQPKAGQFGLALHQEQHCLMFGEQPLIAVTQLPLAGIHNALNCLAVLALGYSAGWSLIEMTKHIVNFSGLNHRCQPIKTSDNIRWINDSKATNVGATLAAINGLAPTLTEKNNLILIAGGDGKGADFSPLTLALQQHVAELITLGKDGNKIATLVSQSPSVKAHTVASIEQAVTTASSLAVSGDIVLLSPACASIDMFKNYMERGQRFVDAIHYAEADLALTEVNGGTC